MRTTVCPLRLARDNGLQDVPLAASGMESMTPVYPRGGGPLTQTAYLMDILNAWLDEKAALRPPGGKS